MLSSSNPALPMLQKGEQQAFSSSSRSLARADTIKASYFDDDGEREEEEANPAAKETKTTSAAAAVGKPALESSGALDLPPLSPPHALTLPPTEAAARLAALSAELERLQRNQAVLSDALARGAAVLVSPSSSEPSSPSSSSSSSAHHHHHHHHSTLSGALADPPLVDPSPGAQAAHKKRLRRQEARERGGAEGSKFVSGGLCGFEVADDLLQVDFTVVTSEEEAAAKEFRALRFDDPPSKQVLRSLRSQAAELLPAGDPKLARFLKQLEAQQRLILKLLAASEESGGEGGNIESGNKSLSSSLLLSPLLKNPLARLEAAGMTVGDDEGTAQV